MDFVEVCNFCAGRAVITAARRVFDSDKICHGCCDFYFGVTFLEHSVLAMPDIHMPYITRQRDLELLDCQ